MSGGDDVLDQVLAAPVARTLKEFPQVQALAAQLDIVARALRAARDHGLKFPGFELDWRHGDREVQNGEVELYDDGNIVMRLNTAAGPEELYETVLHEAQHAADYRDPRLRAAPRIVLEKRALAFVARVQGRQ